MSNSKEIVLDIQESIEKHLPSQVGDVLKKRLKRIETLEEENRVLTEKNTHALKEIEKLEDALSKHRTLDSRYEDVEKRLEEVQRRERDLDVHDANLRAEQAEKRADLSEKYVEIVFKSPVYRQNITGYTAGREQGGGFDKQTTETVE